MKRSIRVALITATIALLVWVIGAPNSSAQTDRLSRLPDGRLSYRLKTPWRNGTTHVVFEPLELVEKLAVLVPAPRANLIRFHGVVAPAAKWRAAIVPAAPAPIGLVGECEGSATSRRRNCRAPERNIPTATWAPS